MLFDTALRNFQILLLFLRGSYVELCLKSREAFNGISGSIKKKDLTLEHTKWEL
jgi:hypothetical protein